MTPYDYDLFVIGAGSGGVRAARMAAARGLKVAVAENRDPGGTCVNRGCVPKKLYMYAADLGERVEDARAYGWDTGTVRFDWPKLRDHRGAEVQRLSELYEQLLLKSGADLYSGHARVLAAHQVQVGEHQFTAEHILIATGGHPVMPAVPGVELALSSDDIFTLAQLPTRMLILGGGYIACEFASIFSGLGVEVHQLVRGPHLLRGYDLELTGLLAEEMAAKGVCFHFGCQLSALARAADGGVQATLSDGRTLQVGVVLAATGRRPNTTGLGLEDLGVQLDAQGAILVDEVFQTTVPGIHALGDVVARMPLTPVAIREAMVLVDHLFGSGEQVMSYGLVPTAVFARPNLATVGLAEEAALDAGHRVRVYTTRFRPMLHSLTGRSERMFMKLVVEDASDRVLGCHMLGEGAAEVIQALAIAMQAGATKAHFDATLGIHPTAAEEFVTLRTAVRVRQH